MRLNATNSGKRNIDSCCVLVVHCCAIKKKVIVASQLYDVADVQFTVENEGPLNFCSLFKTMTLGTLFQI